MFLDSLNISIHVAFKLFDEMTPSLSLQTHLFLLFNN